MEFFATIVIPILTFGLGAFLDRLHVNQENDSGLRQASIAKIDGLVEAFHQRFASNEAESRNGVTFFDYEIRSLVDDTSIRPIIGGRLFDGEFTRLIGEIYKLSITDPSDVSLEEKDALLGSVNKVGIDLKKIISSTSARWRVRARK